MDDRELDDDAPTLFGTVREMRGRPPLPVEERHATEKTVRFTRDEFAEVFRAARNEDRRLAVWIRDAAVMRARGQLRES